MLRANLQERVWSHYESLFAYRYYAHYRTGLAGELHMPYVFSVTAPIIGLCIKKRYSKVDPHMRETMVSDAANRLYGLISRKVLPHEFYTGFQNYLHLAIYGTLKDSLKGNAVFGYDDSNTNETEMNLTTNPWSLVIDCLDEDRLSKVSYEEFDSAIRYKGREKLFCKYIKSQLQRDREISYSLAEKVYGLTPEVVDKLVRYSKFVLRHLAFEYSKEHETF